MQFIKRRQNDPEYLKSVIAQREIVIEEQKRKNDEQAKANAKLRQQWEDLQKLKASREDAASKELANLNLALQQLESEMEIVKHEKSEVEFLLNNCKIKVQESERQHRNEVEKAKMEGDAQKELLNLKIANLEKNLSEIKKYYKVEEAIVDDKKKIVEDSNRDLKGFSNQKQQRLLIIQNQQYKNEIEYQSKNITVQLEKNEKLQDEIKNLRIEVQLHKEIESDLIKRSSLAQSLIKKLYKEIQELKKVQADSSNTSFNASPSRVQDSERDQMTSRESSQREQEETINKLKFEIANMKNYKHYMENMQKVYSKKYETLGSLMADYLENLLYFKNAEDAEQEQNDVVLNINELRTKDIKEWKFEQMEAVIHLILAQLKPYLSKNSLIHFPEIKNVNISFVEETAKEAISLPRLVQNYEKSYDKQAKKGQNRFKDIPIDISTKILRSNLREWGSKIKYGNLPGKKIKSKSIYEQNQKSFL